MQLLYTLLAKLVMEKQSQIYKILFLLFVPLLLSCGTSNIITVTEIDTVIIRDTIQLTEIDSIWHGGIYNDKDSIGSIAVNPKSKTASVNIKWLKPDTIRINQDTLFIPQDNVIQIISGMLPLWAEIILIAVGVLLLAFVNKKTSAGVSVLSVVSKAV